MGVYYRKEKRAPRYIEKQIEDLSKRARRLYLILPEDNYMLIIDDKKYFTLTNESVSTNRRFYTSGPNVTPSQVRSKCTHQKFCFG